MDQANAKDADGAQEEAAGEVASFTEFDAEQIAAAGSTDLSKYGGSMETLIELQRKKNGKNLVKRMQGKVKSKNAASIADRVGEMYDNESRRFETRLPVMIRSEIDSEYGYQRKLAYMQYNAER